MKLNSKLQLATFFISMLMLTACGGGGGSAAPNPAAPNTSPTSQLLDGLWNSQCQASTELTGYDEQQIFNFKGNKLTTNKTFYVQNTNCKRSEEVLRARITANIALGDTVNPGTNTGHTKINITRTKVILVPMEKDFRRSFNDSSYTGNGSIYYGYGQGWNYELWLNISKIEAARKNFKINELVPDIFQISEKMVNGTTHKVLKLGAHGGNVDSESRPLALANSITAIQPNKTMQTQTAQAAGLTGQWKYACRKAKGSGYLDQKSTLEFTGNKRTTVISFYQSRICSGEPRYQVKIEADIVVGKVINPGAANEHTEIGIKTTEVKIKLNTADHPIMADDFNSSVFYDTEATNLYSGYGQTNWRGNTWKDISEIPDAIANLNIGTQVPDIFKISTVTADGDGHKELKMGDYKGSFDINGRAMSFEPQGAARQ